MVTAIPVLLFSGFYESAPPRRFDEQKPARDHAGIRYAATISVVRTHQASRSLFLVHLQIVKLRKIHHGWIVVFATALMLFGGAGSRFSFGVFLKPVTEEFDWSRGSLAGALAIAGLATGGLRPLAGLLADRYDPKIIASIGVLIGGLALAVMSQVQELWHVYITFIVMGIGFTLASPGAVAKIIGAWFTKRRALAMSLAGTGSAAGETALVPTAAIAVAYIGWREGYLILGGILLVLILPLVFLLLRSKPKPGEHADGYVEGVEADKSDLSRGSADPNVGMSFGQACRTGLFWRLTIGFFI
jgi:sugar phosphate permease